MVLMFLLLTALCRSSPVRGLAGEGVVRRHVPYKGLPCAPVGPTEY